MRIAFVTPPSVQTREVQADRRLFRFRRRTRTVVADPYLIRRIGKAI
jgi:hypothetical protein